MMRARALRLSAGFLRELVDTLAAGGVFASEEGQELARLAADLLESALPGLSKADATELERRFLRAVEAAAPASAPASAPAEAPQEEPHEADER